MWHMIQKTNTMNAHIIGSKHRWSWVIWVLFRSYPFWRALLSKKYPLENQFEYFPDCKVIYHEFWHACHFFCLETWVGVREGWCEIWRTLRQVMRQADRTGIITSAPPPQSIFLLPPPTHKHKHKHIFQNHFIIVVKSVKIAQTESSCKKIAQKRE